MPKTIMSALFLSAAFAMLPAKAYAKSASGVIKGYECGDNCYLTIKMKSGKEITALCAASGCAAWNAEGTIPQKLIGRTIKVTIGIGQQYDGGGNLIGDFPAFTKVVVGKK